MAARGTVVQRGKTWSVVIDAGMHPGRHCSACRHVEWSSSTRDERCPKCGAPLEAPALRRRRDWHLGYRTKKAAEEGRTELLGRQDRGEYVQPTRLTLREFVDERWLPALDAAVAAGNLRLSTVAQYRLHCDVYIKPRIGGVRLRDISADLLARLYRDLLTSGRVKAERKGTGTLSTTTVRRTHITVHRMLGDAVRWGLLPRNPADAASKDAPKARKVGKDTMTIWSPAQLKAFLASVADDRLVALWTLFVTTGVRRGEAMGLRWAQVDLDAGTMVVERASVVVDHGVIESGVKTDRSGRRIALDERTVAALRTHRARQAAERLAWGPGYHQSDLVFTWEDGQPIHPTVALRTFRRLTDAAGLPRIRLHDLRHSYATAALEAQVPMKVVQERLGHGSIAVTADIYSHVAREIDQAAAEQVAAAIFGAG